MVEMAGGAPEELLDAGHPLEPRVEPVEPAHLCAAAAGPVDVKRASLVVIGAGYMSAGDAAESGMLADLKSHALELATERDEAGGTHPKRAEVTDVARRVRPVEARAEVFDCGLDLGRVR